MMQHGLLILIKAKIMGQWDNVMLSKNISFFNLVHDRDTCIHVDNVANKQKVHFMFQHKMEKRKKYDYL